MLERRYGVRHGVGLSQVLVGTRHVAQPAIGTGQRQTRLELMPRVVALLQQVVSLLVLVEGGIMAALLVEQLAEVGVTQRDAQHAAGILVEFQRLAVVDPGRVQVAVGFLD